MRSQAVGRDVSADAALRTAVAIALVSAKRKRAAAIADADSSQLKQQAEQLQLEVLRLRESAAALFGAWKELHPLPQPQQQGGPAPYAQQIEQAEGDQEAAEPVDTAKAGKEAKRRGRQRGSGRSAARPKNDPRVDEAGAGPGQEAEAEAAPGGDGGADVTPHGKAADAGGVAAPAQPGIASGDGRAAAMAAVGEALLDLLGPTPLEGPMVADDPSLQPSTGAAPLLPGLPASDPRVAAKARVLERLLGRMQALTNLATAAATGTATGAPGSIPSAEAAAAAAAASSHLRSLLRPGRAGTASGARGQGGQQPGEDAGEGQAVLQLYGRALQHGGALPHTAVLSLVADVLVAGRLPGAGTVVGSERSGGRSGGGQWAAGCEGAGQGVGAAGRGGGGAVFAGLPPDVRRAHLRHTTELLAALVHSLGCVADQAQQQQRQQQQQQQGVPYSGGLPQEPPGLTSSAPLAAREVLLCVSHDLGSHAERLLCMAGGGGSWSNAAGPQLSAASAQPPPTHDPDAAAAAREALSDMLRQPALGQHVLLGAARGVRGLGMQVGGMVGALAGTTGGRGGDPAAAAAGFGGLGSLRGAVVAAAAAFSTGRTLFDVLADACGCVPQWCSAAPTRSQSAATSLAPESLAEALSCLLDAHALGSAPTICAAFPLYGSAVQQQLAGLAALLMHVATAPEFTGCSLVPVCRSLCARIKQSVLLPGAPATR